MNIRLFCLFCCSFSSILLYALPAEVPIKIGCIYENNPYTYLNNNVNPEGFSIDLVKAIMNHAGLEYDFVFCNHDESYRKLKNGDFDLAVYMARTKERMNDKVYFTSPYILPEQNVVTRNDLSISTLSDMAGKKIIVKGGTTTQTYLAQMGVEYSNLIVVKNTKDGLLMLANGHGDCFITTNSNAREIIKNNNLTNLNIQSSELPSVNVCFASTNRDLIVKLNDVMAYMVSSGKYDRIYYNWFGYISSDIIKTKYLYYTLLVFFIIVAIFTFIYLLLKHRIRIAVDKEKLSNQRVNELSKTLSLLFKSDDAVELFMYDCEKRIFYRYIDGEYKKLALTVEQLHTLIHPDDLPLYDKIVEQVAAEEETVKDRFHSINTITGKYCLYEYVVVVVERNKAGKVAKYAISRRDCSDSENKLIEKNNLIKELNNSLRAGKLLRWQYDFQREISFITAPSGKTLEYDLAGNCISKGEHRYVFLPEFKTQISHFIDDLIKKHSEDYELEIAAYDNVKQANCYFRITGGLRFDELGQPCDILGV